MRYFYLSLFIIAACALTADMILRYMEKIANFGLDKRLFKKLALKFKNAPIPAEKFFPETITNLLISILATAAAGFFFDWAGLVWYFSPPCAIVAGMLFCFIIQHFGVKARDYFKGETLPKGEAASGLDGYCAEDIEVGGWGKVRLFYKDAEYEINAASANETAVSEGDKVISLYESGGFYFVVKNGDVFREI